MDASSNGTKQLSHFSDKKAYLKRNAPLCHGKNELNSSLVYGAFSRTKFKLPDYN